MDDAKSCYQLIITITKFEKNFRKTKPVDDIKHLVSGERGKQALETGDTDAGIWSAGMVAGLIHDIPTCRELVDRIMREAVEIIDTRLSGMRPAVPAATV